mmetsp:Transcript_21987/g.65929  ORF Transcript_21987/g.65929 Transcript_21987/m.65929 type:complete len:689 (+) Transcript_21987:355-2421(+)
MATPQPGHRTLSAGGGGIGGALKAADHDLVVYLQDAWAARAILGGRRKLELKPWATVREVKAMVAKLLKVPVARQRLFWRSTELEDRRTLEEAGVHKSGATLLFDARPEAGADALLEPVSTAALHGGDGALPPPLSRSLLKARRGLVVGARAPELALDGTGGTYFLAGLDGKPAGCFKPSDEETFCVNNPRLFVGAQRKLRRGVRPGEAHAREVAAYLLDARSGGVAGVPATTLAASRHAKYAYADRRVVEKLGSFQCYVPHDGVAEDFSASTFDAARLQAIAALDVRCLNSDRNAANLLVPSRRGPGGIRLVPIDHGFCLPEVLSIEWFDWCWIDWPALAAPVDETVKARILELDANADAEGGPFERVNVRASDVRPLTPPAEEEAAVEYDTQASDASRFRPTTPPREDVFTQASDASRFVSPGANAAASPPAASPPLKMKAVRSPKPGPPAPRSQFDYDADETQLDAGAAPPPPPTVSSTILTRAPPTSTTVTISPAKNPSPSSVEERPAPPPWTDSGAPLTSPWTDSGAPSPSKARNPPIDAYPPGARRDAYARSASATVVVAGASNVTATRPRSPNVRNRSTRHAAGGAMAVQDDSSRCSAVRSSRSSCRSRLSASRRTGPRTARMMSPFSTQPARLTPFPSAMAFSALTDMASRPSASASSSSSFALQTTCGRSGTKPPSTKT